MSNAPFSKLLINLFVYAGISFGSAYSQGGASLIRMNQVGFYPGAPKIAVLIADTTQNRFIITSEPEGDTVFRGNLSEVKKSANSSLTTRIADFTPFKIPGTYNIIIPGNVKSFPFVISVDALQSVSAGSVKGYYYQRASVALPAAFAGKWSRAAGHPDTIVFIHPSAANDKRPAGTTLFSPGGWYDAGDYNKYIVNSGITMGTLLSAYEDFSSYFDSLQISIPENGNGIPALISEILYNLRWMITMQDPNDGGVYHKCTNAAFDGMVMPDFTKLPRYLVQKSTAASLDFAAVLAQASRILSRYKKQLPGLSDSCLQAAVKSWDWSLLHPDISYNQDSINKLFEPKITTGAYGDNRFSDEWFWAAAELYISTGLEKFHETAISNIGESISIPSWNNVTMLGYYSLIRNRNKLINARGDINMMSSRMIQFADELIGSIHTNAFLTVMGKSKRDFAWGSNSVAANQGIVLVNAYKLTHNRKYLDGALANIDYLLGRNATGYCFVTGFGSRYPMHPHHRPSVADKIEEPVPGLMVGGPNPGRQDHCTYLFTEPETAYLDSDCSYASNEIAINWNAPLVYLVNALEALKYEAGYSR